MIKQGVIVAGATAAGLLAWPASPAQAHPLGNFSVNQYAGLTLHPDRVDVSVVVDAAEIPTLQDRASDPEAECARVAARFTVTVNGQRLTWTVSSPAFALTPGAGGLNTSRLSCRLSAPAGLAAPATVRVDNGYRTDRIGWREMTAAGDHVGLTGSGLPSESVSGVLRAYPRDLLSSALDVRSATITTSGTDFSAVGSSGAAGAGDAVTRVSGPGWLGDAQSRVQEVVGGRLAPAVVGLAFLLALLLGAGHAVLPGHGKTVMAAYFAGRRGRIRDAVTVGATVTLAHTAGVLALGLVLSTSTALAGERVLSTLGVVSGVLVVLVGVGMLVAARRSHGPHGHSHSHSHGPHHSHGPGHSHGSRGRVWRRLDLAGIGLAGGLVPSPSALVVLLGAIGLGRAGLGVALVIAYGLGMAATLTAVGLLLVVAQNRLARMITDGGRAGRVGDRLSRLSRRVAATAPTATAALVVVVGLGIGARAVA